MFRAPQAYAEDSLAIHYGDKEAALLDLYAAAKAYPNVPIKFWRDVAKAIESMSILHPSN